jgi:hypothetical protein
MNHRSFGRRDPGGQHSTEAIKVVGKSTRVQSTEPYIEQTVLLSGRPEFMLADGDLPEWKRARKPNFGMLWRRLSLMATLCFGIASFALPDLVNDAVDWLLYATTAASFYAWISSRRQQANT